MGRPSKEIPLVTKIARAFKKVDKLPRRGTNKTRGYGYPTASDVLEAVRLHLFSEGVICCPSEAAPEYVKVGQTNGGESLTECRLAVTYVFQDAAQKLEPMTFNGIGRDVDDKSLYKAQTGAQKALLKRFGLLAEEDDDPEFDGETAETLDEVAPMRKPARKRDQPIRDFEIRAIEDACADTRKSTAEISEAMLTRFKAAKLADLKRYQFKEALAWASNGAGTLAPKPQAAPAVQGSLPLPKPAPSFEMRVGGKTEVVTPKTGSYAL